MTITQNQLRRYSLERQGLLERQPLAAMLELGVLHATDHATPYLSLLARLAGFRWEHFADKLYEEGQYIRWRCMRGTLHMIPHGYINAIKCAYRLQEDTPLTEFREYNISVDEAREVAFFVTEVLQQHGALSVVGVKKHLDPRYIISHKNRMGGETVSLGPIMRWMWGLGQLESGVLGVADWRKKDDSYRLAQNIPTCDEPTRTQADLNLCRWYFDLYAPASYEDWAWWSGLKADRARAAFAVLQTELTQVAVAGMPQALFMPVHALPALEQTPDEAPFMVRLLPYEDALIKAYKDTRYRFYDEEGLAEDMVFNRTGEALPTLWVDGRIMGGWSWVKKPNEPMTVEPFIQMTKALRKRLKPEIERVQAFVEASHVLWTS